MDGTLIDSEPYWIDAEMALAARFGVAWTHADGLTLVGFALDASARILIARGIPLSEAEIIDELVTAVAARAAANMPWLPDARALLVEAVAAGIPCALVTMSIGVLVDQFVADADHVFGAVVTGDQVARGKPDPEAYLVAAARLGVDPADCIAVEDSPVGVRAAHGSGAATIAVRGNEGVPVLPGVTTLTTLEGIDLASLADILARERGRRGINPS
jgi:HAD superfamily hydrolase (TIGR01509 family)